jgi:PAS domain S-box-containing protein
MWRYLHTAGLIFALGFFYFCAGSFGLSLASIHPSASAVWPASGIALATILLWGYWLWPGIFLGAFLVNLAAQGSLTTALGIAAGNTFEAILAAALVCRFAQGAKAFAHTRTIFKFILLAGVLSTAVGATIGVSTLILGEFAPWNQFLTIWLTWWLGDMVGNLIVAPLIVLWTTQHFVPVRAIQVAEAAALLLALAFVGWLLFLNDIPSGLEYLALIPLLWAALRFGRRGAVTAACIMSAIAVGGTVHGFGPFATSQWPDSLLLLQLFTATLTVTALVVASVVSERRRLEQRLRIKDAVSRILAEAPAVANAAPKIIQVMCEAAEWDLGAIWNIDRSAKELACVDFWSLPSLRFAEFEAVTRRSKFAPGVGLPGRVWSSGKPEWISDVSKDSNFPRGSAAITEGLRAGVAFPVKLADQVVGIMECLSREIREPDSDFLEMVDNIGAQFGQFIEHKRAEDSLRAKEAQLRLITDTAPVMLVQCSRDGRYRFVNHAYAGRFGLLPEQIVGKSLTEVIGNEAAETIRPHIQRVLNGESLEYEIEVPYERIGRRFMQAGYVPEKDANGNVTGWVCAISDITDRKQADAALQHAKDELARANEELEQRVQQRTAELQLANTALSKEREEERRLEQQLRQAQKMESIGTLAGGIAHDFNNILNIIKGYVSLLRDRGSGDGELTESLQVISETIERGASTVRQLLVLAKESAISFERVDLNDALQKLRGLLGGTFPRTIDIILDLDTGLQPVLADPNQVNQVLLNICVNARDAMPEGGELRLRTTSIAGTELQGQFHKAKRKPYACITVSDTGSGIDGTIKSRIFEPFFTTKEQDQGTGLGLSVAYGIVANHGGFIDVASEPRRGTTFCIYFPIADQPGAVELKPPTGTPYVESAATQGRVVLFVEDELRQLELMRGNLEKAGYRVLTATDGVEAVETFLQHKDEISVVVLDLGLPKLNGWEAFKKMKKADPTLKPILASGYISDEIESAMTEGQLAALIAKPYRPNQILETISLAINSGLCAKRSDPLAAKTHDPLP